MCYNMSRSYTSPPKLRWAGLEPAIRLHGSAFQERRVCHSTTSASRLEGDEVVQAASPSNPPNKNHTPLNPFCQHKLDMNINSNYFIISNYMLQYTYKTEAQYAYMS